MRYTYCSSFRQGKLCQASLSGSRSHMFLGAFLSAIILARYLPYICAYVSISAGFPSGVSFLGNRSIGGIRPDRLLTRSTTHESHPLIIPFRCLFSAPLDGC